MSQGLLFGADVTVNVDNNVEHQEWLGFGAHYEPLMYSGLGDVLTSAQRTEALRQLFEEVGVTTGHFSTGAIEAPASSTLGTFWENRGNDNIDPFNTNANGFYLGFQNLFKTKIYDQLSASAKDKWDVIPNFRVNKNRQSWLFAMKGTNYQGFLNELAEAALVTVQDYTNTYGDQPPFALVANEPHSGNIEIADRSSTPDYLQTYTDIVKTIGARLVAAGYTTKLVIAAEETTSISYETAQAVMNDVQARQYVGAIAFHNYPYSGDYSYIPNILNSSGSGSPEAVLLIRRTEMRNLAAQYGIQLWMNEVSNGYRNYYGASDGVLNNDFRAVRGRSIHIHDEMLYARINAFYGMNAIWDWVSEQEHFADREDVSTWQYGHGNIIQVDQANNKVNITGIGYAIGHYARYFGKGAQVVDSNVSDALVQVTAVRDDADNEMVFVIINNANTNRSASINLANIMVSGQVNGIRSTVQVAANDTSTFWVPLTPFAPTANNQINLTLPAESVTTIAVPIDGRSN